MEEFSREQQVVIAMLRHEGVDDPEELVRGDRLGAALLGSHMDPVLTEMTDRWQAIFRLWQGLTQSS